MTESPLEPVGAAHQRPTAAGVLHSKPSLLILGFGLPVRYARGWRRDFHAAAGAKAKGAAHGFDQHGMLAGPQITRGQLDEELAAGCRTETSADGDAQQDALRANCSLADEDLQRNDVPAGSAHEEWEPRLGSPRFQADAWFVVASALNLARSGLGHCCLLAGRVSEMRWPSGSWISHGSAFGGGGDFFGGAAHATGGRAGTDARYA